MKVSELIASYKTDPAAPYASPGPERLRFRTREHYDGMMRRIEADLGQREIASLTTRDLLLTHQLWMLRGIPMAHALVGMLRTLCGYGGTLLEDDACITLAGRMGAMRFKMGKPRTSRITADQVVAVRKIAHQLGHHSVALAQAFQFDLMLRQRDCIGEWIPVTEPGESDVTDGDGFKWLRGIRRNEIDDKLVLRHITSKRQKPIEVDLKLAPMVMEELRFEFLIVGDSHIRIRTGGPVVVNPVTGLPFVAHEFRRVWRKVARACGIPDNVFNMDSRAGAISEATDAGASLELVRHAATHSDVATTARYSRGSTDKIAEVMRLRAEKREIA